MTRQKMSVKKAGASAAVVLVTLAVTLSLALVWKRHVLVHDGTPQIQDYVRRNLLSTFEEKGKTRRLLPREVEVLEIEVPSWRLLTSRRYRPITVHVVVETDVHQGPQKLDLQFRPELGTYRLVRAPGLGY